MGPQMMQRIVTQIYAMIVKRFSAYTKLEPYCAPENYHYKYCTPVRI